MAAAYASVFGTAAADDQPERVLVNIAKALAAFQETIVSGRTPFDDFRDAMERGDREAMARYPVAAQRGLRIFVGKGQCSACHFGPNFTNGEFDDVGVPHFAEPGRVDQGRHGGIALLRASPFSLLGPYNDDPARTTAAPTRHVEPQHRNWGEFRVPSLRNVALTAPYMHNGSLPTLEAVVRHYSEVDIERLHGDDGARLVRPLHLSPREIADLVSFLETLSAPVSAARVSVRSIAFLCGGRHTRPRLGSAYRRSRSVWIRSTRDDLKEFPEEVRGCMGHALVHGARCGAQARAGQAAQRRSAVPGVVEIVRDLSRRYAIAQSTRCAFAASRRIDLHAFQQEVEARPVRLQRRASSRVRRRRSEPMQVHAEWLTAARSDAT